MATVSLTRGLDRNQWLDRPSLARLIGKGEDTVRRDQREHQLETRIGPNNCVLLRLGDFIDLGRVPTSVLDPDISAREVADALALRAQLEDLHRTHAELVGRQTVHEELVTQLRAHLATQAAYITRLEAVLAGTR